MLIEVTSKARQVWKLERHSLTSQGRRFALLALALVVLIVLVPGRNGFAAAEAACTDGTQNSGALYRICSPDTWNGILIVDARGAVYPQSPLKIVDPVVSPAYGVTLLQPLTGAGFAFATSSYSRNGLSDLEGVDDLADVVSIFKRDFGEPAHTIIVGFSGGGLVSTLSVERRPASTTAAWPGAGQLELR